MKIADKLEAILTKRFGEDFRKNITTTLSADVIYWIIHLAELGIEVRQEEFRKNKGTFYKKTEGWLGATECASLSTWQSDMEDWVEKIEVAITPKES